MADIELQECQKGRISAICAFFDNDPAELINVLHKTQEEFGYLPASVQRGIASHLGLSVSKVYGVVSFYSFFTMTPKGKYPISVCTGTACYVRGAEELVEKLSELLEIKVGEVSSDGKFSLDCLRCVGACGLAPVLMVGEKVYGKATPSQLPVILAEFE